MENKMKMRLTLPLDVKILLSQYRIKQFHKFKAGEVYVSYSGGKDSIVLLHLVRSVYPGVEGVFFDNHLEYPDIREFISRQENIRRITPKLKFKEVVEKYGYPVVSKENSRKIHEIRNTKSDLLRHNRMNGNHKGNGKLPEKWKYLIDAPFKISDRCCYYLKKQPAENYEKETGRSPYIGMKSQDSRLREHTLHQCNIYDDKRPRSNPLSFWTDADVWQYIKDNNLEYPAIYDRGLRQTGCMYCLYGAHFKDDKRLEVLQKHYPKQYNYFLNKLNGKEILKWYPKRQSEMDV